MHRTRSASKRGRAGLSRDGKPALPQLPDQEPWRARVWWRASSSPETTSCQRLPSSLGPGDTRRMAPRLWLFASLFWMTAGCGAPTTASPPPGPGPAPGPTTPGPGPEPIEPPAPTSGACTSPAPGPGFECVRDCGPPVARQGDPPPGHSWLSAEQAQNRRQFGCPICLPAETRIATPSGERAVSLLRAGDPIWTTDPAGRRVRGRVLYAASTPTTGPHQVVRVTLADGRVVAASPGHPTLAGRALYELRAGDPLSGSVVSKVERARFVGARTFDVLPSGATGAYWADGVLLGSSFHSH